ncbi:MAG: hypothetical protein IT457_14245 [Planctomycetes bacterium]|nr:hypothetical protein [Planctomycetota bacterium]
MLEIAVRVVPGTEPSIAEQTVVLARLLEASTPRGAPAVFASEAWRARHRLRGLANWLGLAHGVARGPSSGTRAVVVRRYRLIGWDGGPLGLVEAVPDFARRLAVLSEDCARLLAETPTGRPFETRDAARRLAAQCEAVRAREAQDAEELLIETLLDEFATGLGIAEENHARRIAALGRFASRIADGAVPDATGVCLLTRFHDGLGSARARFLCLAGIATEYAAVADEQLAGVADSALQRAFFESVRWRLAAVHGYFSHAVLEPPDDHARTVVVATLRGGSGPLHLHGALARPRQVFVLARIGEGPQDLFEGLVLDPRAFLAEHEVSDEEWRRSRMAETPALTGRTPGHTR